MKLFSTWLLSASFLLCTSCAMPSAEQYSGTASDRDAVSAVVQLAFDAIRDTDADAWRATLLEEGTFTSLSIADDGNQVGYRSFESHLANLDSLEGPTPAYLERWWDPVIMIEGDIAMVWTPYDFLIDGNFSHAGIDVIVLLRIDDGWKIASIAWTANAKSELRAP